MKQRLDVKPPVVPVYSLYHSMCTHQTRVHCLYSLLFVLLFSLSYKSCKSCQAKIKPSFGLQPQSVLLRLPRHHQL